MCCFIVLVGRLVTHARQLGANAELQVLGRVVELRRPLVVAEAAEVFEQNVKLLPVIPAPEPAGLVLGPAYESPACLNYARDASEAWLAWQLTKKTISPEFYHATVVPHFGIDTSPTYKDVPAPAAGVEEAAEAATARAEANALRARNRRALFRSLLVIFIVGA